MNEPEPENIHPWIASPTKSITPYATEATIDAVATLGEQLMPMVDVAAFVTMQEERFSPEIVWLTHAELDVRFAVILMDREHADAYMAALKEAETDT